MPGDFAGESCVVQSKNGFELLVRRGNSEADALMAVA